MSEEDDVVGANNSAVVLLSGGLDSATVLAMARARGLLCHALSVDYGQRQQAELDAARVVAAHFNVASHRVVRVDLRAFGGSALTDDAIEVPKQETFGIPSTYVPARNTVLLALALACAEVSAARYIFVGVNAVDYSGYPDCRPEFIAAFQAVVDVATKATSEGAHIHIEAPLIGLSKASIVQIGNSLNVPFAATVSCYEADSDGRACAQCDACRLRRNGFVAANLRDPTRYRL